MLKLSHNALIIVSGLLWFAIGTMLLTIGVNLLVKALEEPASYHPLFTFAYPYFGDLQSVCIIVLVVALIVGFFKGRVALGRSAKKVVARIRSLPNPTPIYTIYSKGYYILLASMIGLGLSIKYFGLPDDVRGFIDVAIGAALINGGSTYFRIASVAPAKS